MPTVVIEELLAGLGLLGESATATAARTGAAASELGDFEVATKGAGNAAEQFKKKVGNAIDAVDELADRIISLRGGASKYNDALANALGNTVLAAEVFTKGFSKDAVKMIGGIYVFNETVLKYAQASLRQHDLLVKSYDSLSEFGALDPNGLEGVLETAKSFGTVPENMGSVIEALRNYSTDIANMGGTVNQGVKQIAGVVNSLLDPSKDYSRVLTNLGYTTQDITKYGASFVTTNSKSIQNIAKDQGALTSETNKYLEILTELSELTGVSRDAQAKAAEELQRETQWRSYLRDLAREPNGAEKVKQANLVMAAYQAKAGKDMADAAKDALINGGATTAATAQNFQKLGNTVDIVRDGIQNLKNPTKTLDGMLKSTASATGTVVDNFRSTIKIKEGAQQLGIGFKDFDNAMYNSEDAAKAIAEQMEKTKTTGDSRLNEENRRMQAERAYANMYQDLYLYVSKYALPAVRTYTETLLFGAKKLIEPLVPGFNGQKSFKNYDESRDRFNKIQEEVSRYEKEKATHEEAMRSPNRAQAAGLSPERAQQILDQNNPKIIAGYGGRAVLEDIINQARRAKEQTDSLNKSLSETRTTTNGIKLNVKPGAIATGTELNPTLTKLAEELTKTLPNLRVTGVNEPKVHSLRGKHYTGQAIDVALEQGHKYTREELDIIRKIAEGQGFKMIPELEAKGGPHLHLEKLEAIKNQKPVDLNSKKESLSAPSLKQEDTQTAMVNPPVNNVVPQQNPDDKIIISKLDDLHGLFTKSLRVQEDILTHTKMLA